MLFFFLPAVVFCQDIIVKGIVLDAETKAPIPYVNISVLESDNGTSSLESGVFSISIEETGSEKSVKFSALGYENRVLKVSQILINSQVFLSPKIDVLDEVLINKRLDKKYQLINPINESDLCSGFGTHSKTPWILALHFPFKDLYNSTEYLDKVTFHLGLFKNAKSKFRLRIFETDTAGLPGRDLLKNNVIVELKRKQKLVEVDISEFDIVFPKGGIYIAFEWLYIPYNEEEVTFVSGKRNQIKEKRLMYYPKFSATCEDEGKFKIAAYISGEWHNYSPNKYNSDKKSVPAISLTLSN